MLFFVLAHLKKNILRHMMRKKKYQILFLAFFMSAYSQTWKHLVAEGFMTSIFNGISCSSPSSDIASDTISYTPVGTTNTLIVDGSTYQMSFFAANLVKNSQPSILKNSLVHFTVRDQLASCILYSRAGSLSIPRSSHTTALFWQEINSSFQLPPNYTESGLHFNFYDSDTDPYKS